MSDDLMSGIKARLRRAVHDWEGMTIPPADAAAILRSLEELERARRVAAVAYFRKRVQEGGKMATWGTETLQHVLDYIDILEAAEG